MRRGLSRIPRSTLGSNGNRSVTSIICSDITFNYKFRMRSFSTLPSPRFCREKIGHELIIWWEEGLFSDKLEERLKSDTDAPRRIRPTIRWSVHWSVSSFDLWLVGWRFADARPILDNWARFRIEGRRTTVYWTLIEKVSSRLWQWSDEVLHSRNSLPDGQCSIDTHYWWSLIDRDSWTPIGNPTAPVVSRERRRIRDDARCVHLRLPKDVC